MTTPVPFKIHNKPIRHWLHERWNHSRWNSGVEPFVSGCSCCCIWCESPRPWWKCVLLGHWWAEREAALGMTKRTYCYRCASERL